MIFYNFPIYKAKPLLWWNIQYISRHESDLVLLSWCSAHWSRLLFHKSHHSVKKDIMLNTLMKALASVFLPPMLSYTGWTSHLWGSVRPVVQGQTRNKGISLFSSSCEVSKHHIAQRREMDIVHLGLHCCRKQAAMEWRPTLMMLSGIWETKVFGE